jgi:hypothetical protein
MKVLQFWVLYAWALIFSIISGGAANTGSWAAAILSGLAAVALVWVAWKELP